MPEQETNNNIAPFEVDVNGVKFEIRPNKVTKGTAAKAGVVKYRPDVNKISLEDAVTAWGDKIKKELQARLQALFNGISDEALEEAGDDEKKFVSEYSRMFTTLSSRGESMKALVERRNTLLGELADLSATMGTDPEAATRFQDVAKEIAQLQADIADKKHKDEVEATTAPAAVAA
jgi:hypothetical protein